MLVLTRKKSEVVRIGEDISIMVVAIEGNRVRLGIRAPQEVVILRGEKPLPEWLEPGGCEENS